MPAQAPSAARPAVVVIGAGINGAAIARRAALGGLDVVLLERDDIGGGTSAASTRLIHGGLRYLEHGELGLVRESLREREALLETAPHLVEPLGLHLPLYRGGRRRFWQIRIGLWLYDLLAAGLTGAGSLPEHRMLSREQLLERMPGLAPDGLVGGAYFFDAQIRYPERLVVENVLDAARCGARILNHTRAARVLVDGGAVRGVEWQGADGSRGRVPADVVINAAGPWIDDVIESVLGAAGGSEPAPDRVPLIGGTKGSHLVVEPFRGAPASAVYSEAASDGRPFFVIPWNGLYLIGTTDVRYDGDPGEATISEAELRYLVSETERLFPGAALAQHIRYTQAGIRPLPYRPGEIEGAITRRHLIHAHREPRGLYSIIGGKLTTHRSLAAQVLARLSRDGLVPGGRRPAERAPLPGTADEPKRAALLGELGQRFGAVTAGRLWNTYGGLTERLLTVIAQQPELAAPAAPGSVLLRAELVRAIEAEWAGSLIDVLQRRTMVGLGPDFGLDEAPAAADALVELALWDRARAEEELAAYRRHAARFVASGPGGLSPSCRARSART
ncbi:MAG: glycerol-3-phosphate dehydrogenase/oxidase [Gammaproteobacteria bacterium]|nr:glycerol-3-phosphate dehydrogenase/oxidase [Gammaproteobacteria bacterium]